MADDDTGANPTIAQKFLEGWVTPASTIVTTLISLVAAIFAFLGRQEAADAAASAAQIERELGVAAQALEETKVNNDYTFKIIDLALESLNTNDLSKQGVVLAVVKTMPDQQLRGDLLSALTTSEQPAIRADANLELGKLDFQQTASAPASVLASSSTDIALAAPSPEILARTQVLTMGRTHNGGTDVDIFWCQRGNQNDQRRYADAQRVALRLTQQANGSADSAPVLGRIRLRPLPAAVNQRSGYRIQTNELRYEPGENAVAQTLLGRITDVNPAVVGNEKEGAAATPNYLSFFFCAT